MAWHLTVLTLTGALAVVPCLALCCREALAGAERIMVASAAAASVALRICGTAATDAAQAPGEVDVTSERA